MSSNLIKFMSFRRASPHPHPGTPFQSFASDPLGAICSTYRPLAVQRTLQNGPATLQVGLFEHHQLVGDIYQVIFITRTKNNVSVSVNVWGEEIKFLDVLRVSSFKLSLHATLKRVPQAEQHALKYFSSLIYRFQQFICKCSI